MIDSNIAIFTCILLGKLIFFFFFKLIKEFGPEWESSKVWDDIVFIAASTLGATYIEWKWIKVDTNSFVTVMLIYWIFCMLCIFSINLIKKRIKHVTNESEGYRHQCRINADRLNDLNKQMKNMCYAFNTEVEKGTLKNAYMQKVVKSDNPENSITERLEEIN